MKPIYLDHAATTPMDLTVLAAMQPYLTDLYYNPSASYDAARDIRAAVNEARANVAHYFGAKPSEIIFAAGGTEANNMAVHGVMQQFPDGNVIVSSIEHDSVLLPAQNYDFKLAQVDSSGRVKIDALAKLIDDNTVLVSVQYANNEIGTVQSVKDIAQTVATVRKQRRAAGNGRPLYVHTDACQAPAYLDIHASRLGVDMMTINASKIYGPKQTGALLVRTGVKLQPHIQGGGQERGLRSGTENVAGVIGLATALTLVQQRRSEEVVRMQSLQQLFIDLLSQKLPKATINGPQKHRLPNNVHLTIPGQDNERLMMELDQRGILCAVGSACSASNDEPSHVLMAIGLSAAEAQSSLRFSMGRSTNEAAVRHTVTTLAKLIS